MDSNSNEDDDDSEDYKKASNSKSPNLNSDINDDDGLEFNHS